MSDHTPDRSPSPYPPQDPTFRDIFEPSRFPPPAFVHPAPRRRFQHRVWKHVVLLLITLGTTTIAGGCHYAGFASDFNRRELQIDLTSFAGVAGLLLSGLWYSGTMLLILGAHEMGHYAYCRRYRVDATLPYFLPAPIMTGTFGAVIRIREAFPTRAALFDIGVAGPIAGFVVLLPALFLGLQLSHITLSPPASENLLSLGEPLLFQWATELVYGTVPEGYTLNMHPMVFAAWFGMLATALNLLPFGQLDGGHIAYATLGSRATTVSLLTVAGTVAMTLVSLSWLFMALMMLAMLFVLGPRHPRVVDEYEPLGRGRVLIAVLAAVILAICFTPAPIEPYELIPGAGSQSASR